MTTTLKNIGSDFGLYALPGLGISAVMTIGKAILEPRLALPFLACSMGGVFLGTAFATLTAHVIVPLSIRLIDLLPLRGEVWKKFNWVKKTLLVVAGLATAAAIIALQIYSFQFIKRYAVSLLSSAQQATFASVWEFNTYPQGVCLEDCQAVRTTWNHLNALYVGLVASWSGLATYRFLNNVGAGGRAFDQWTQGRLSSELPVVT